MECHTEIFYIEKEHCLLVNGLDLESVLLTRRRLEQLMQEPELTPKRRKWPRGDRPGEWGQGRQVP